MSGFSKVGRAKLFETIRAETDNFPLFQSTSSIVRYPTILRWNPTPYDNVKLNFLTNRVRKKTKKIIFYAKFHN